MEHGSTDVVSPRHSDVDRPVARILPAVVTTNSNNNCKSVSSSSSKSSESFSSFQVEPRKSALTSLDADSTMPIKTIIPLGQSTEVSSDLDQVRDGVEVLKGRRRPRLLPKPKLLLGHLPTKQQSSLPACTVCDATDGKQSGFALSTTEGNNSAGKVLRQESLTGITGNGIRPTQRLNNDDEEPLLSSGNQPVSRRTSRPIVRAASELVVRPCAEQQQRRGSSNLEQEAESTPSKNSQNLSTSSAMRENCRTLPAGGEMFWKLPVSLDPGQVERIELFYASHATQVSVCRCLASLYFSSASTGISRLSFSDDDAAASAWWRTVWNLVDVGVPVLVVDTGEGRRRRQLHVVLADAQTGFPRWREAVDHLTDYRSAAVGLHTLRLSQDHGRLAALRFRDDVEAARLMQVIETLTSDPDDPLFNLSAAATKRRTDYTRKWKTTKATISSPCCFSHVTQLDRAEAESIVRMNSMSSEVV